ncbi:acyltransferase family protein [Massilia sp. DWR3-1-1]|uniref:acyltransferase family protein n=1 Tax=Massilia sp. DWR3-1-1 TaxID=2804559 RepID=UPI003CF406E4
MPPSYFSRNCVPARIHGLDTLRALAVSVVVLHHYVLFVSGASTFGWLGDIGWVGVDLFFALSGYLIGSQIFSGLRSADGFSLGRFYGRRLLRTLPNFYAVLALYYLWPWFRDGAPMLSPWRFLSFTQNILLAPGSGFSHAWSLCIEEQFYMLLPALALLIAARRRPLALAWTALAATAALGLAARGWLWHEHVDGQAAAQFNYFKYIYYASLCRLDELLAGVALALLKHAHPGLWQRLTRHGDAALALGLAVLAATFYWFLLDRYGLAVTLWGYPLLALGFGLLLLAALDRAAWLGRTRIPGCQRLALWSYAIYLVHKPLGVLAAKALAAAGFGPESALTIGIVLAVSVLGGVLLYVLVEAPFMALRERYLPAAVSAPGGAARLRRRLR